MSWEKIKVRVIESIQSEKISIRALTYSISKEKAGFSDTTISNKQKLKQVVTIEKEKGQRSSNITESKEKELLGQKSLTIPSCSPSFYEVNY